MISFIKLAISQFKASISLIIFVILMGLVSRCGMPVEEQPEVVVPIVIVQVIHLGISPEDGARLLIKPMEQEVKTLSGVVETQAIARENGVYLVSEFDTGVDIDVALQDMRDAIDRAKVEFPDNTEEPIISEQLAGDKPVIIAAFSSDTASEREIYAVARDFQQKIEGLRDVLKVKMSGARDEVAEIVIRPEQMDFYGITVRQLSILIAQNNILIPAGALESGSGNFGIKVPALIESVDDIKRLPVLSSPNGVVTLGQIADVRRTFKDASSFGRINGSPAIALEVGKRLNANIVDAATSVRKLIDDNVHLIPAHIQVEFVLDRSAMTQANVQELTGNIVSAMALVMILVVASLGLRYGLLVGFGIPFSLLGAAIVLHYWDFTFNFMVLFGLLLSLGMLIDGGLVVVEYASRKVEEGMPAQEAFIAAVQRMAAPIIASTLTTLAAFFPLLFWPGVVGDFMSYLPRTVFAVLVWSVIFSLLVAPILGSKLIPKRYSDEGKARLDANTDCEETDLKEGNSGEFSFIRNWYMSALERFLQRPLLTLMGTLLVLFLIFFFFIKFNPGVEFFHDGEDIDATISIRAQGNLTIDERREIAKEVEQRIAPFAEISSFYVSTIGLDSNGVKARDQIASVYIELVWSKDRDITSKQVLQKLREATADIPGVIVQVNKIQNGPPIGKDIQLEISADSREVLHDKARVISDYMASQPTLIDVENTLSLPGIEWQFKVNKANAAMIGMSALQVGQMVQMLTGGVYLGEYRPDNSVEEVEIRLRFPSADRSIEGLKKLRVSTVAGSVPISSFVDVVPEHRVDVIERIDSVEIIRVSAYTAPNALVSEEVKGIKKWVSEQPFHNDIKIRYRGASEEVENSGQFLLFAFGAALCLMMLILVSQFNSFYQSFLIISAVVMSTAGVMLGQMILQMPFGMVLNGIGMVALAGIVVNNNIVLIDTYNRLRHAYPTRTPAENAYLCAKLRFRPVMLTTLTTVIGLLPLANGASMDLLGRSFILGSDIASFWSPLAKTIVNGLSFSTFLTLLVTPTMLVLPSTLKSMFDTALNVNKKRQNISGS